ncbi:hypothetical protein ZWY2020_028751 [Hordeum vulgare]|nr:hypothetical protein ZWY2020_028751 [Hordeum vulgare]
MAPPRRVCVMTGGGGLHRLVARQAAPLRGYINHATVRDPYYLDGAAENLRLFKADVLDSAALARRRRGVRASSAMSPPVPADKILDPEAGTHLQVMVPAVKGTVNILEVCSSMKSSEEKLWWCHPLASVHFNPSCASGSRYCLAKTVARKRLALEYAEKNGLNVYFSMPLYCFWPANYWPAVQHQQRASLSTVLKGGPNASERHAVARPESSVRDVADALLLVYEKPESSGRYVSAHQMLDHRSFPITPISSAKLKNLGWKPRELENLLLDSIEYYRKGREFCRMAREAGTPLHAFLISSVSFMPPGMNQATWHWRCQCSS